MSEQFDPLSITDRVKELYADYIWGTFPIDHEIYTDSFKKLIRDNGALWNGPFVSLAQTYLVSEKSCRATLQEYGITDRVIDAFGLESLYSHQAEAIKRVIKGQHVIVSTGTGSGKTESFLIPVIDHCLKAKSKGLPGIKAIIIYPMNALANDQHERLRRVLYDLNLKQSVKVTAARYTGGTPRKSQIVQKPESVPAQRCPLTDQRAQKVGCLSWCPERIQFQPDTRLQPMALRCQSNTDIIVDYELISRDDIEANPPDILITNYVQLEYLLLNRSARTMFSAANLRFIVLDELHTYAGARGIEVALLLRRLRERVKTHDSAPIVHIGTSATISSGADPQKEIATYATTFFGTEITEDNVVLGKNAPIVIPDDLQIPSTSPALLIGSLKNEPAPSANDILKLVTTQKVFESIPNDIPASARLGYALKRNRLYTYLQAELSQPRTIEDLAVSARADDVLQKHIASWSDQDVKEILWTYLILGSQAVDPDTKTVDGFAPLIRPNVHVYFRTIGQDFPYGELFACLACNRFHDGVALNCTHCEGILEELGACRGCGAVFYKGYYDGKLQAPTRSMKAAKIEKEFGLKRTLAPEAPTVWFLDDNVPGERYVQAKKCKKCGFLCSMATAECPGNHKDWVIGVASSRISSCPYCDYSGGQLEAVSSIYLSPNVTSRIIFEFVYSLLPKHYRKLLVFSDSRQDASYLAGTIEYEHRLHMLRQIIYQSLSSLKRQCNVEALQEAVDSRFQDLMQDAFVPSMQEALRKDVMLEVSTTRARKKSLESLGLVRIIYRGLEGFEAWATENPDDPLVEKLRSLKIDAKQFAAYLIELLNVFRHDGALEGIERLQGIGRDAPCGFMVNSHNAAVVQRGYAIKQPFQPRSAASVITSKLFPSAKPMELLQLAMGYLQRRTYIVEKEIGPRPKRGTWPKAWFVAQDKIVLGLPEELYVCDRCGGVYFQPLPQCLGYRCHGGKLVPIEPQKYYDEQTSFHLQWYRKVKPVRLIAKEDTGALPQDRRQRVEGDFKTGKIDLIACTPTLELGIDIGDLAAVAMAKSPPSPASYVQRAGRAGRRSRISLIINFAFQSKIDQFYFNSPAEMLRGRVRPPFISLDNQTLVRRHVNSVILETTWDKTSDGNGSDQRDIETFIRNDGIGAMKRAISDEKEKLVNKITKSFADIRWLSKDVIEKWL